MNHEFTGDGCWMISPNIHFSLENLGNWPMSFFSPPFSQASYDFLECKGQKFGEDACVCLSHGAMNCAHGERLSHSTQSPHTCNRPRPTNCSQPGRSWLGGAGPSHSPLTECALRFLLGGPAYSHCMDTAWRDLGWKRKTRRAEG